MLGSTSLTDGYDARLAAPTSDTRIHPSRIQHRSALDRAQIGFKIMTAPRDYVYISDAKVDTFVPQAGRLARRRLRTVDRRSEAGLDVKVGGAGVSGKTESSWQKSAGRVDRLMVAERLIRENFVIGALDDETLWFEGELNMHWDYYSFRHKDFMPESYAVVFGGERPGQALALGGSAFHLTDWGRPDESLPGGSNERLWYTLARTGHPYAAAAAAQVDRRRRQLRSVLRSEPEPDPMGIFEYMLTALRGAALSGTSTESLPRLRFFARRLMQKSDACSTYLGGGPTRMTLATPLWVARAS